MPILSLGRSWSIVLLDPHFAEEEGECAQIDLHNHLKGKGRAKGYLRHPLFDDQLSLYKERRYVCVNVEPKRTLLLALLMAFILLLVVDNIIWTVQQAAFI